MAVNPRHTPRPASTGMVARHGPESWPGMLRNWWPAWTGIRTQAGRYREFTQLGFECLSSDPKDACAKSLELAQGFLHSLGLRYELDSQARRGLSYYLEGQGFELRCLELGAQQQVAGGGAYREGAGFAIGAERLLLAMKAQRLDIRQ